MQIRTILLLLNLLWLFGCGEQKTTADLQENSAVLQSTTISTDGQNAYDRALAWAEAGDARVILLCDSLLQYDSARAGAAPFYYLGIYYTAKKDPQRALQQFDRTIVTDYRFLEAYIEKAALLQEMKRPEQALRELELLRTISPGYAPVHYWIGKVSESVHQRERALQHYRLALSIDSTIQEAKDGIRRLEK